ncbi:hypothetical protein YC2023_063576 [Brassica napus]
MSETMLCNSVTTEPELIHLMREAESDSKRAELTPLRRHVSIASRSAKPSAIKGDSTKPMLFENSSGPALSSKIQPRPAAASDLTFRVSCGTSSLSLCIRLTAAGSCLALLLHSRARIMAEESVSSGEAEKPSKKNLFLDFQIDHKIHGKREPELIPAGEGRGKIERQGEGKKEVERSIEFVKQRREDDPYRPLLPHLHYHPSPLISPLPRDINVDLET